MFRNDNIVVVYGRWMDWERLGIQLVTIPYYRMRHVFICGNCTTQRWKNMRTMYSIRFDRTFLFFTWPTNIDYVLNHVIQVGYLCLMFFFSFFFFTTECSCAKAILNFPISVSRASKQSVYWFLHFVRKKTPIVSKEINSFVVFVSGQCGRYCVEYRLYALRNLYSMVRFGKKNRKEKKRMCNEFCFNMSVVVIRYLVVSRRTR